MSCHSALPPRKRSMISLRTNSTTVIIAATHQGINGSSERKISAAYPIWSKPSVRTHFQIFLRKSIILLTWLISRPESVLAVQLFLLLHPLLRLFLKTLQLLRGILHQVGDLNQRLSGKRTLSVLLQSVTENV